MRSGFNKKIKNHSLKITDSITSMENLEITRRNSVLSNL